MGVYRGVVRGRVIELDEDVQLTDGLVVDVRTLPAGHEHEATAEERFQAQAEAEGLLRPRQPTTKADERARTPIEVRGKPLSEMIIEERR